MLTLGNPPLPAHLILDPLAPIPASMGKRDRARLMELREAYVTSIQSRSLAVVLNNCEAVAEFFRPILTPLRVESLAVCALNSRLKPMGPPTIVTRGDVDGTEAGPRAIMRTVLVMEGTSFIIAHNHPTGDPSPSPADVVLTQKIREVGRVLDCPLQDHVILSAVGDFYSFRQMRPDIWR